MTKTKLIEKIKQLELTKNAYDRNLHGFHPFEANLKSDEINVQLQYYKRALDRLQVKEDNAKLF